MSSKKVNFKVGDRVVLVDNSNVGDKKLLPSLGSAGKVRGISTSSILLISWDNWHNPPRNWWKAECFELEKTVVQHLEFKLDDYVSPHHMESKMKSYIRELEIKVHELTNDSAPITGKVPVTTPTLEELRASTDKSYVAELSSTKLLTFSEAEKIAKQFKGFVVKNIAETFSTTTVDIKLV